MSKANKVGVSDDVLNRDYLNSPAPHERHVDFRKRVARRTKAQTPAGNDVPLGTPERDDKSHQVKRSDGRRSERLSPELPAGIRQLLSKGTLTGEEGRMVSRFRADYDLAYYSSPGLTSRYGESTDGGGGNGVADARAAVTDARSRMALAKESMTSGCWDVLCKMTVFDFSQVEVGGVTLRYKDAKARRYTAGILLIEALGALEKVYC